MNKRWLQKPTPFLDRLFWAFCGGLCLWISLRCWIGVVHGAAAPLVSPRNTFGGAGSAAFPLYADSSQAKFLGIITTLGTVWCARMLTVGTKSKPPSSGST